MAKQCSFDVVCETDMQEVDNAFQQTRKALSQRYDLKGSGADVALDKGARRIVVKAPSEFVAKQVIDVLESKLVRRNIELSAVKWGETQSAAGQSVVKTADIVEGIDKETGSKIGRDIRDLKLKAKVQIEGDKLRVTSASRDTLQEVIAFLREQDYGLPLQYVNYR